MRYDNSASRGGDYRLHRNLRDNRRIILKTVLGRGVAQRLFLKPKVHYHVLKIQPFVLILRQMNPVYILISFTYTVTTLRTSGDIPPLPIRLHGIGREIFTILPYPHTIFTILPYSHTTFTILP